MTATIINYIGGSREVCTHIPPLVETEYKNFNRWIEATRNVTGNNGISIITSEIPSNEAINRGIEYLNSLRQ